MKGCKVIIKSSFLIPEHSCKRSLWRDGYCKIHHPLTIKRRQDKEQKTLKGEPVNEYPSQEGVWALVAPDGKIFMASSPIKACLAEAKSRIPLDVRMRRIMEFILEPEEPHDKP